MQTLLFSALLAGMLSCTAAEPTDESAIEASELAARLAAGAAPAILDVRSPEEFAAGHIPGAINVPHTELAERLATLGLDAADELVVHCERGGRATAAERVLRDAGHTNVRDLTGHMQAWRAAGHPLE